MTLAHSICNFRMMLVTILISILSIFNTDTQEDYPVTWRITSEKTSNSSYNVNFKAFIADGWVIYGMHTPDDGPVATSFNFEEKNDIVLEGQTLEITEAMSKFEPLFDIEVLKFSKKAVFTQKMTRLGSSQVIKGTIKYMACDGTKCLPPTDVPFITLLK